MPIQGCALSWPSWQEDPSAAPSKGPIGGTAAVRMAGQWEQAPSLSTGPTEPRGSWRGSSAELGRAR